VNETGMPARPASRLDAPPEFRYRLPRRVGGQRPGTHAGTALGTGLEFLRHARLFDRPDPRRLDLRASLSDLRGDWLVRVNRQRAAVTVRLLADVSASMRFGTPPKIELVADFAQALGHSAFRVGDPVGLLAFDHRVREDAHVPPWRGRGIGEAMAALLRGARSGAGGIDGLLAAAAQVGGRPGLVFLASDFHWPLARLGDALDALAPAHVVPLVVWDAAELHPPARDGLAPLADAETGARRTLWLRPRLRAHWAEAVADRRRALGALFAARGLRPFWLLGRFDATALTGYFFEDGA
jgi:uncharacterized protein (DUF58 family)